MKHSIKLVLASAAFIVAADGMAQQQQIQSPAVHATRGQSQAQLSRDEDRCHVQARKKTGFDPVAIAENATPLQPGKGITSVPIEAPSTAMGSSGAAGTTAGAGDMGAGNQQMGSSAGGQTSAGNAQMANPAAAQGVNQGNQQMGASSAGQTGAAGNEQMGTANAQAGTSSSGAWSGKSHAGGATGASAAGSTSAGGGQQVAMVDSAEVYNQAFAKCMTSRGYMVESAGTNQ